MKKTLIMSLLILSMLVLLTGCVSVNYEVTINKDGSGKISYIYGYKKEFLESMETTSEEELENEVNSAKEQGFTVEPYEDEEYEGFKAYKEIEDITKGISLADLFGEDYVKNGEDNNIKKDGNTFSQNAIIDLTGMKEMSNFGIVMKYSVKLPSKVKTTNATQISEDGKTLTWDLVLGEENSIQFEAKAGNEILLICITCVIIVAILGTVIFVLIIKKKKSEDKSKPVENKE